MSQLEERFSQPEYWEELIFFLRRLETERFQENGWQEPYESRGSRTVLWGTGGEIPPVYQTQDLWSHIHPPEHIIDLFDVVYQGKPTVDVGVYSPD
jgi:hypothetical protein